MLSNSDRFLYSAIELLRLSILVLQTPLDQLSGRVVQHRNLLIARENCIR